jgi:poly-gamma-glutamate synthesis protein (capsule biosynthesis protein)
MSESHVETPAYDMRFSVDDAFLPALKEAHFTHLSLANNHSFDHGQGGYKNAISMLEMNSLTAFGNGETIDNNSITYLSTNRGTIALIGINATQRIPSDEEIAKVFLSASRHSSFQVAFIHWGNEYEPKHSSTQRILAEILVSAGADLIVGHHPHVVQDVDIVKGVVVFYSLGNYIFDQYFSKEVQNGLVIALDLQNNPTLILTPTTAVNNLSQPTPMAVADQQKFLHDLSLRSHPSLMEKIKAGSVPLLDTVATSTKVAMM